MTKFLLVRHGQSEANKLDLFAGHSDFPLTELGTLQAQKTAQYITNNFNIDAIYSSDLRRAYETALPVSQATNIKISSDKKLREVYAGAWESLSFDTISERFAQDKKIWQSDIANCRCTGGESVREMADRILCRLTEIAENNIDRTVLITFHATPIRAMQAIWQTGSIDNMKDIAWVPNASVTVAEYENGQFKLISVGIDEHLDSLRTYLPPNV